jgi:hypothetical protein
MRRRGPSGASKLPITVKEKTLDKVRAAGVAFIDEEVAVFGVRLLEAGRTAK